MREHPLTPRPESRDVIRPKLSVCIPTFNRAAFISQCLDSVLAQLPPAAEIVIVDGASTDNTEAVVAAYTRAHPAIHYIRRDVNVGIDADVLLVVEASRGQYCWLMSDDDRIEPGAIAHVLDALDRHPDVAGASVNYASYDSSLRYRIYTAPAMSGIGVTTDVVFRSRESVFRPLGVHLGYLSAQIVRRDLWADVAARNDLAPYMGTAWLLVYVIGLMLGECPSWLYIHKECVANRSANDSFITRVGGYRRQLIAHATFDQVISGILGTGTVRRAIFETLVSERMPKNLASYKANGASLKLQGHLLALYARRYWSYPVFWWKVFPIFLIPNWTLALVRRVYLWRAGGAR